MTGNRVKIEVGGLREFQQSLRKIDSDLPKMLRLALNEVSTLIINDASPKIPTRTGRARGSLKARSSQRAVRIAVGGRKAPYYPWLDFGGQGRVAGRPGSRPFITEGRYLYPGLRLNRDKINQKLSDALTSVATAAGMDVD